MVVGELYFLHGGEAWEVRALWAPGSERNDTPWWFVLVGRPGRPTHPFDWWPERSFRRAFRTEREERTANP